MDRYGLIGYPLGHSFSRNFFNRKFNSEHIQATYDNFPLRSLEELRPLIEGIPLLKGFNVTIPYKQQIIPMLDQISDNAKAIGAVNVVRIERNGQEISLHGYNTDAPAFAQSLQPLLQPHHRSALILGTGGASKAVEYALQGLGIGSKCVSRTAKPGCLTYEQVTLELLNTHHIIVNCTPLGMYPQADNCPPIPYQAIGSRHLLYDLIYNPEQTLFLRNGEERAAQVKNGLEMLHLQALATWEIWKK